MNLSTEANRITGLITALVIAAIPLLARAFGWTEGMAEEWEALLLAAVPFVVVLVGAEFARGKVWSQASHEKEVQDALFTQPPDDK